MDNLVNFQLNTELVGPLIETLQSRAQAWQDAARILRTHQGRTAGPSSSEYLEAQRMAGLYQKLVEQLSVQLQRQE